MKKFAPLIISSIFLISACERYSSNNLDEQKNASSPTHNYQCESGEKITANYHSSDSATIQYQGHSYTMQIAVSGSGSRYVGESLEWQTKGIDTGSEALLSRHLKDGTSGENIEFCTKYW